MTPHCDRCYHLADIHAGIDGCLATGCPCVRTSGSARADSLPKPQVACLNEETK